MKPLRLLVTYTAKPGQRDAFLRQCCKAACRKPSGRRTAVCGTTISCRQNVRMSPADRGMGIGRTAADTSPTASYAAAETAEEQYIAETDVQTL
ncbi:MAG: hypothetical protein ACLR5S_12630 [Ruminococcus sp.]